MGANFTPYIYIFFF